jgi:restriction endonuclease S subunit
MRKKLKELAAIQVGYTFRVPPSSLNIGDVAVIQARDLATANTVAVDGLARIQIESPKDHHLVKPGDLVFKSRGGKFTSAIVADYPGVAVVAGPLFRIRVSSLRLVPEYLNWFICHATTQKILAGLAKGTMQQMISKEALEDLEIPVPSLDRQKVIVALASLGEEERNLMIRITEQRERIISAQLIQLAKGE